MTRSRVFLAVFVVALLFTYAVSFSGEIISGDNIVQFYETTQIVDRARVTFTAEDVREISAGSLYGFCWSRRVSSYRL